MPIPPRRRTTAAIIAGLVALALAACDPADPDPPPPPSISAPTSSSPSPTVSIQERDYAAAAEAFRNASRLIDEAIMNGDGAIPEDLSSYVVPEGPFWQTETTAIKRLAEQGKKTDNLTKVVAIDPIGDYTPNLVRIYVCVDGRMVVTINKDGTKHKNGALVAARLLVRKADGKWRVQGYEERADGTPANFQPVSSCEDDPS